ncbi:MAG: hypothetical protein WC026_17190 [Hyphomicrobium sp.]|uniref:hypothetical protein n=1 Tax=Hyphomicrobium sp. TaxID=82 RepID=UPI0035664B29
MQTAERHPNFRPQRKHRRAAHVGKVRQRLAKAIAQAFSDQGFEVVCEPSRLWPAKGAWKHHSMDVFRWEGHIELRMHGKMQTRSIASWDSMTECLKGFTMWQDGFSFEVGATDDGCSMTERYVLET